MGKQGEPMNLMSIRRKENQEEIQPKYDRGINLSFTHCTKKHSGQKLKTHNNEYSTQKNCSIK